MIRINLQHAGQRKAKKRAPAPADTGGGGGGGVGGGIGAALGNLGPAILLLLPIVGGAGGSFYVHQSLVGELHSVQQRTRVADAELAKLKPVLDELNQYKRDKEQLEQKLAAIRQLQGARTGPVKIFAELGAIMPPQVWVTGVREHGLTANLDGVGLDSQSVAVFVNAMHHSPYFGNVELTSVEQIQYLGLNVKRFTVTCQFRLPAPAGGTAPPVAPAAAPARPRPAAR
jgi:type IV pilus assembly protein PilN